ncbi:MAG: HAD family phosphatase [Clostridiales bacterium]|nr:HAD family phosphatase [Clostridiales bacterium]
MKKLLLSDLDHTLIKTDGSVSEHTLDVLARCREAGVLFAIATARYWIGAEKYIDLLKPDFEITTDGTLIHADGKCIYSSAFTKEDTNRIVQELMQVPGALVTVAVGRTVYWNSKHIAESPRLHKAVYCEYDKPLNCCANKIAVEMEDESVARRIAEKMGCRLQCYRGEKMYAFLPKDSGKIAAIRAMAEQSGIELSDIVAFGDDLNDIEMLSLCGTGVAVSNAIPEVLEVADQVTLSNDEDGVADWAEKNLF